jgi:hypothetical protein
MASDVSEGGSEGMVCMPTRGAAGARVRVGQHWSSGNQLLVRAASTTEMQQCQHVDF